MPSGENATLKTKLLWPSKAPPRLAVRASHSRTVPSRPAPETMRVPSGENAMLKTQPLWPLRLRRRLAVGVPQPHRAVRAAGNDARAVGRERDARDPAVWPLNGSAAGLPSRSTAGPSRPRRRKRCACRRARTRCSRPRRCGP